MANNTASNIERFLIEFGFKDKKILRDLQQIAKSYDNITKTVKKTSNVENVASKKKIANTNAQTTAEKKALTVERARLALRKKIEQADKLGITTTGFKATASRAKKPETIAKRDLELSNLILQKQIAIRKEKEKQKALESQTVTKAKQQIKTVSDLEQRRTLSARRLDALYAKRLASRRGIESKVEAFRSTPTFRAISKFDARRAEKISATYRQGVSGSSVANVRSLHAAKRALADYGKAARNAEKRTLSLKTAQSGLTDSTRNMIRGYASLYAVFASVKAINEVGQGFEAVNSAMLAAMGGKQEATAQMEFLDELTSRLGMSLLDTADQYTKFIFASKGKLPTEEVNFLFQSMAEMGTVLGVSKERMKLSMTAIQQMMNKGTVSSEELKRQFAESMPGGIQLFARALNLSEAELLKQIESGNVLAKDVLPKVAVEMAKVANTAGALEAKYKTTRVTQGKFFKQLETGLKRIFYAGFDEGMANIFLALSESLQESEASLHSLGKTFKTIFNLIASAIRFFTPVLSSLVYIMGEVIGSFENVFGEGHGTYVFGILAIAAAVKILGTALSRKLAIITAIILGLENIFALFSKGTVGSLELAMGKDIALSELLPDMSGIKKGTAGGLLPPQGLNSALGLGEKRSSLDQILNEYNRGKGSEGATVITQEINVSVPAGANKEFFESLIVNNINKANDSLARRTYLGGQ